MGAKSVTTIDIQSLVYWPFVSDFINYATYILPDSYIDHRRLSALRSLMSCRDSQCSQILELESFSYHAPVSIVDQKQLLLSPPFDLVYSVDVLEHVPYPELSNLFASVVSVLSAKGTFLNRVDLRCHLSYADKGQKWYSYLTRSPILNSILYGRQAQYINCLSFPNYRELFGKINMPTRFSVFKSTDSEDFLLSKLNPSYRSRFIPHALSDILVQEFWSYTSDHLDQLRLDTEA